MIAAQINRVYAQSDYVGSLVTQGETGRATEYDGLKVQPPDWWQQFWKRHEENTGETREQAIAKLRRLRGLGLPGRARLRPAAARHPEKLATRSVREKKRKKFEPLLLRRRLQRAVLKKGRDFPPRGRSAFVSLVRGSA
jgi:hypothetical protein